MELQPRPDVHACCGDGSGGVLQTTPAHCALPAQVTSQAHAAPQLTVLHEFLPAQSTVHAPVPHVTPWQLPWPLQVIVHATLLAQLTPLRHELAVEQSMLHDQPVGHVTSWLHAVASSAQSIVQVFCAALHDVHSAGHVLASASRASIVSPASFSDDDTTHNPSVQVRPVAQSAWVLHEKSPLRWLTEQSAKAITDPKQTTQSAMSFTAFLRG